MNEIRALNKGEQFLPVQSNIHSCIEKCTLLAKFYSESVQICSYDTCFGIETNTSNIVGIGVNLSYTYFIELINI